MTKLAPRVLPRPTRLRSTRVAEIMTLNPIAFENHMPIQKAWALLKFNQLDCAPVVDEDHRLAGVVTAANCAAWEEFTLRSSPHGCVPAELDMAPVWEISSPVAERISEGAPADEAITRLAERRVRRIYVVNREDELVGVVSMGDLIRHLTERATHPRASTAGASQLC